MTTRSIEMIPPEQFRPWPRNARTHSLCANDNETNTRREFSLEG